MLLSQTSRPSLLTGSLLKSECKITTFKIIRKAS